LLDATNYPEAVGEMLSLSQYSLPPKKKNQGGEIWKKVQPP